MAKGKTKGKWGGVRPGAGNPYKWKHRETKPVRLPIVLIPSGGDNEAKAVAL